MRKTILAAATALLITTPAFAESFWDRFNFSVKPIQECEYAVDTTFLNHACDSNDGVKLQLDIDLDNDTDNNRDTHSHGKGPEKGRGHFEHGNGKGLGHYK